MRNISEYINNRFSTRCREAGAYATIKTRTRQADTQPFTYIKEVHVPVDVRATEESAPSMNARYIYIAQSSIWLAINLEARAIQLRANRARERRQLWINRAIFTAACMYLLLCVWRWAND
jgi:hypothetical protein